MRLLGGYGGVQGFFVISSTERNSDPKREYT
jgi:phage protein U